MTPLEETLSQMVNRIVAVIAENQPTIYLYGSAVTDDFRLGWSDIDILVLIEQKLSRRQANALVGLRQALQKEHSSPYHCLFEGGILSFAGFMNGSPQRVVYWGSSGQRVANRYDFDCFAMAQLLDCGLLLYGKELRGQMRRPSHADLRKGVARHYAAIREHAQTTSRNIHSYGWLLDIARCIYTLHTGEILAKTAAGEWALEQGVCPVPNALRQAIAIRREPMKYINDEAVLDAAQQLGPEIQCFAGVLEQQLNVA